QGPATEFETLIHPEHDGYRLRLGQDAQADDKPRVVVDQARDPGFDVSPAKVDEERAFQVDVPKLVGPTPLIARTRRARHRTAAATARFEELVNVVGADSVKAGFPRLTGRPTVLRSQEQEAGALLIPVPTNATVRIGWVDLSRVRHAGTVGPAVPFLSRKFN